MNDLFRYDPTELLPFEIIYPHWTMILDHCGKALDKVLADSQWGQNNGIVTGGQYLTIWIASMLRNPDQPLPYLFFWGNQNCGKSIFREAVELLCTRGCVQADFTLMSCWNSELEGAIFCYLEETCVNDAKYAKKLAEWVASPTITIRQKRNGSWPVPNLTHWCQMSNCIENCLSNSGYRIVKIRVGDLVDEIPKRILKKNLREEAPQFMQTLMQMDLPPLDGRLGLPVLTTE